MKLVSALLILLFTCIPCSFAADTNDGMSNEMERFLKEKEESRQQFNRMKGVKKKTPGQDEKNSGVQFTPPVYMPQISIAQGVPGIVIPTPVGEYLFSGNADDTSGQANHARVIGALMTEDRGGNENSAYIFYERPHRIEISLTEANTFSTGSFTVSFWLKTKDNPNVMKGLVTTKSNVTPFWGFHLSAPGQVTFFIKNQEGQSALINASDLDDQWHHVVGVRNAEQNTMSLYVDGALIQTRAGVSGDVNSGDRIWVGDHENRLFVGRIDDIRLWNQALNDSALAAVHTKDMACPMAEPQAQAVDEPGIPAPVGMYMFDGNAQDSSGNQNHGIVTGADLTEDRAGNTDRAYLFYKRPHTIKIPLIPQNTFTSGSFTVTFWIKTVDQASIEKGLVTNDSGSSPSWGFKYSAQGKVVFRLRNQEGDSSFLAYPINDGHWHHVTGTRNAANHTMSLYVDSSLVGTRSDVPGSVNSLGDIWVGDHENRLFKGRLDDVVLWDKAFSEARMVEYHTLTANLPLTYSLSPDADNKQEPVGHYSFDGDATDASPEHNDGIVTAAHLSPDRFGHENKAYCFYERNNRIKVPLIPANTFSKGSFTVSLRLKINDGIHGLMNGLVTNDMNDGYKWGLFYTENGHIVFIVGDKEGQHQMITHPVNVGTWYHVIAVRNAATNTISLYVDDHRVGTKSGVSGDVNTGGDIWIGEHTNMLFRGCIDDVILWRRALSDQDIRDMNMVNLQVPLAVPLDNKKVFDKKTLDKQHLLPKF